MTRRARLAIVACVAALAAAAFLVLLARGVETADGRLERLRQPDGRTPDTLARGSGGWAAGLADRIVGTSDDRAYLEAVGLIEAGLVSGGLARDGLAENAEAITRLLPFAESGPDERRSQAATLIGALYHDNARIDEQSASRWIQQAVESFAAAVRLDPDNAEAKRDLELLLAETQSSGAGAGAEEGSGSGGAGETPTGSGY